MKNDNQKNNIIDDFDEEEFMLNKSSSKTEVLTEDDIIDVMDDDTFDFDLLSKSVKPKDEVEIIEESIPTREEHRNNKESQKEKVIDKFEEEKKEKKKIIKEEKKAKKRATKEEKKTIKEDKEENKEAKKNKRKKKDKFYVFRLSFVLVSFLFVAGCCIFYGSKLIKYYRIYNPKGANGEAIMLIANSLTSGMVYETENDGAYRVAGATIFKGENVNNYFKYSGLTWRILSINVDGTIDLTLEQYINNLSYSNKEGLYNDSTIRSYLNDNFYNVLDKENLVNVSFCADPIKEENNQECEKYVTTDYVRLISMNEFINSINNEKTYLDDESNMYWLIDGDGSKNWHTSGMNLSSSSYDSSYYVKPVIRIKNTAILGGGDGSKENPYYITDKTDKLYVGGYVKLGGDKWIIYDIDDNNIRLASSTNLSKLERFSKITNLYSSDDTTGVYNYLNKTFYNSLTYKDLLKDYEWDISAYDGTYANTANEKITAKVGLLNVSDLKINLASDNYWLLTPSEEGRAYYYDDGLVSTKISLTKGVRPTINIENMPIIQGDGTINDPFVLGGEK